MSEKNVFQKRAAEIAGVSCLAVALFLLLALLSYHPLDPSSDIITARIAPPSTT